MADSDVAAMVPTTLREAQPGRYLDELAPLATTVGYGSFGLGGDLGYEGKSVIVQGQRRHHALSSHAPARLLFCLGGGYSTIRCAVGFNDDVPPNRSHCDFLIVVDGRHLQSRARGCRQGTENARRRRQRRTIGGADRHYQPLGTLSFGLARPRH